MSCVTLGVRAWKILITIGSHRKGIVKGLTLDFGPTVTPQTLVEYSGNDWVYKDKKKERDREIES